MVDRQAVADAYAQLYDWAAAQHFSGYDPYDGVNTGSRWLRRTWAQRVALTYVNKFSPLNMRPLLGIQRRRNVHALALIGQSLVRQPLPGADVDEFCTDAVDFMLSKSLHDKYGYHCWNGIDMHVQQLRLYQAPDTPGVIGTEACARFMFDLLRAQPQRRKLLEPLVRSARDFFVEQLYQEFEGAAFIRYKPTTPEYSCTYNASLVAAAFVAEVDAYFGISAAEEKVAACMRYVASRQQDHGAWGYSIDLRSGVEKPQVDFHQGFVLDALQVWLQQAGADTAIEHAWQRGLQFYREQQFSRDGRGYYRWPRKWPVNIHNQTQGIITFARAAARDVAAGGFAWQIADYSLRQMRDDSGYFYFMRYPGLVNRVAYLRWGQASMLNALSQLLEIDP